VVQRASEVRKILNVGNNLITRVGMSLLNLITDHIKKKECPGAKTWQPDMVATDGFTTVTVARECVL